MPAKPGPLRPHEARRNYVRRTPLPIPPGQPDLGDTFLIVTEGEVTERLYFEKLRAMLQLSAAHVQVVHPPCTDAEGLVRAAMSARDNPAIRRKNGEVGIREIVNYDHVWVIFDTDVPQRQSQLGPALDLARAEKISVALSTPSVEFWLLLHFRFTTGPLLDCARAGDALGSAWGRPYDKRGTTFENLWPVLAQQISTAVGRAEQVREHHRQARTQVPANPSTDVDRLVCALNAAVQPPLRIL